MLIAKRELRLKQPGGDVPVPVRLYAPCESQSSWNCRIEIGWPTDPIDMEVGGEDAVQAIELALKTIGAFIYTSEFHARGELMWLETGKGYGFPVPNSLRDMLIGDDQKFF
jgi:hypothetical protein